jgi:hypothetical protein
MLEWFDKNFKETTVNILQQVITSILEANNHTESLHQVIENIKKNQMKF